MQVHSLSDAFRPGNTVVTMGTFDGVHTGHRAVISRLKERSAALGAESVVVTFYPHPRKVIPGNSKPMAFLTTPSEKRDLLEKTGVDHLLVIDFNLELSMMEACDFVEKILIGKIGAKHLIVGFNHRFGRGGKGDYNLVRQCADKYGVTVEKVEEINSVAGTVSSSLIRDALVGGRLEEANRMLGYAYSITGTVAGGRKLGRELGFPTANISGIDPEKLIPANGVYATEIILGGSKYLGMMNIGTNPTVNSDVAIKTVEVNIFDFNGDIYGSEITVLLKHRLRDEEKFSSLEELSARIAKDREDTLRLLR